MFEVIIILVVGWMLFFGDKNRIGEIARLLGKFSGEFKKGKMEVEKEIKEVKEELEIK